jgi:hypothetical protein
LQLFADVVICSLADCISLQLFADLELPVHWQAPFPVYTVTQGSGFHYAFNVTVCVGQRIQCESFEMPQIPRSLFEHKGRPFL